MHGKRQFQTAMDFERNLNNQSLFIIVGGKNLEIGNGDTGVRGYRKCLQHLTSSIPPIRWFSPSTPFLFEFD
jgi:hypothetical protein